MKRFARRMARLSCAMERAAAEAVNASALQAAQLARELVPVDSGELRASIHVQRQGPAANVVAGAAHAAMVEYGSSAAAPQPYMLPAARAVRGEFIRLARRAMQEVLS